MGLKIFKYVKIIMLNRYNEENIIFYYYLILVSLG